MFFARAGVVVAEPHLCVLRTGESFIAERLEQSEGGVNFHADGRNYRIPEQDIESSAPHPPNPRVLATLQLGNGSTIAGIVVREDSKSIVLTLNDRFISINRDQIAALRMEPLDRLNPPDRYRLHQRGWANDPAARVGARIVAGRHVGALAPSSPASGGLAAFYEPALRWLGVVNPGLEAYYADGPARLRSQLQTEYAAQFVNLALVAYSYHRYNFSDLLAMYGRFGGGASYTNLDSRAGSQSSVHPILTAATGLGLSFAKQFHLEFGFRTDWLFPDGASSARIGIEVALALVW